MQTRIRINLPYSDPIYGTLIEENVFRRYPEKLNSVFTGEITTKILLDPEYRHLGHHLASDKNWTYEKMETTN